MANDPLNHINNITSICVDSYSLISLNQQVSDFYKLNLKHATYVINFILRVHQIILFY